MHSITCVLITWVRLGWLDNGRGREEWDTRGGNKQRTHGEWEKERGRIRWGRGQVALSWSLMWLERTRERGDREAAQRRATRAKWALYKWKQMPGIMNLFVSQMERTMMIVIAHSQALDLCMFPPSETQKESSRNTSEQGDKEEDLSNEWLVSLTRPFSTKRGEKHFMSFPLLFLPPLLF